MTTYRRTQTRQKKIAALLAERGYISVEELSRACDVSVITIRRDLIALGQKSTIARTHGGVVAQNMPAVPDASRADAVNSGGMLADRVDALIVTVLDPATDAPLLEQFIRRGKPIIAELLPAPSDAPVVSVDNDHAGFGMGQWAGQYARQAFGGQAHLLDLTYHLPNTQARSQGFLNGLRAELPAAELVLSANAQSNATIAYQLTRDALQVHPRINLIFAINDTCALGAVRACEELNIDPADILIIPFGLEGSTMRGLLHQNGYIKAGVAMFPEAAALICLQAAVSACAGEPLPAHLPAPHAILTANSLPDFYSLGEQGWKVDWSSLQAHFDLSLPLVIPAGVRRNPPLRIGFTVRYRAHEWYRTMRVVMADAAEQAGLDLEIIDITQTLKDELDQRRAEIARQAVRQLRPGSVILLDSGPIAAFFAHALAARTDLTGLRVVTNASDALKPLQANPNLTVICTGGVLRPGKAAMTGPTAEAALETVRADQVFLMVSGMTAGFGLSHDDIAEVSIKQAMMKAAREVILLADYTCFGQESFVHFAPLSEVDMLITDETLPASLRLELTKQGITVQVAE